MALTLAVRDGDAADIDTPLLGVLLQAGDRAIPSWSGLRQASTRGQRWQYFATMWLYLAVPLSEGGIPVAIVSAIGLTGAFVLVQVCNHVAHAVLVAASSAPRRQTV